MKIEDSQKNITNKSQRRQFQKQPLIQRQMIPIFEQVNYGQQQMLAQMNSNSINNVTINNNNNISNIPQTEMQYYQSQIPNGNAASVTQISSPPINFIQNQYFSNQNMQAQQSQYMTPSSISTDNSYIKKMGGIAYPSTLQNYQFQQAVSPSYLVGSNPPNTFNNSSYSLQTKYSGDSSSYNDHVSSNNHNDHSDSNSEYDENLQNLKINVQGNSTSNDKAANDSILDTDKEKVFYFEISSRTYITLHPSDAEEGLKSGKLLLFSAETKNSNDDDKSAKSRSRRSRAGCLTCRQRKKRCCEKKPVCSECSRLNIRCRWPVPGSERKNRSKNYNTTHDEIKHEVYGVIKVLRGVVDYKMDD